MIKISIFIIIAVLFLNLHCKVEKNYESCHKEEVSKCTNLLNECEKDGREEDVCDNWHSGCRYWALHECSENY